MIQRQTIPVIYFCLILQIGIYGQEFSAPQINAFDLEAQETTRVLTPIFGDFDNDGDQDFFTTVTTGEFGVATKGFDYWENIGTATEPVFEKPVRDPFGLMLHSQFGEANSSFHLLAGTVGDLDDDGDLDIIVNASYPPGFGIRFFFYENLGDENDPIFGVPEVNPFGMIAGNARYAHKLEDMDNDGLLDILYLEAREGASIGLLQNQGTAESPSFNDLGLLPLSVKSSPVILHRVSTADMDSDGDMDILAGVSTNGGAYAYFENQGENSFVQSDAQPFGLPDPLGRCYPTFIDLDNDEDLDIMTAVEQSTPYIYDFYYYENTALISSLKDTETDLIRIYPTATDGPVQLSKNQAIKNIELYTSDGILIKTYPGARQSLNLSSLQTGIYFLVVHGVNQTRSTTKVLKL